MQPLNNLDVVILIIVAISVLIGLCRGLVKEVLSILGWILAAVLVVYLLPILTPFAQKYIASSMMAGIVTSLIILIVFYVFWLLSTDKMIGKVRTSKLSALDRVLGLVFGFVRGALIIILFNILVTWLLPEDSKTGMFEDSRYFTLAGRFAEPIESLIPQDTIDLINNETAKVGLGEQKKKEEDKKVKEKETDSDELFEKLAKPQIEKAVKDKVEDAAKSFNGYDNRESEDMDRLIETATE